MNSDLEDQADEILALKEICQDDFIQYDLVAMTSDQQSGLELKDFVKGGKISVSPNLQEQEVSVEWSIQGGSSPSLEFVVQHLVPFELTFFIPPNYPSCQPPTLALDCQWVSRKGLDTLKEKLRELWVDGCVVLFSWINFLKEESLDALGIRIEDGKRVLDITELVSQKDQLDDNLHKSNDELKQSTQKQPTTASKATGKDEDRTVGLTSGTSTVTGITAAEASSISLGNAPTDQGMDIRYGFVNFWNNFYGFIRCLGDGKEPLCTKSRDEYEKVRNMKPSQENQQNFNDFYFRKKSVRFPSMKDFKRGCPVCFNLETTKYGKVEAKNVRLVRCQDISKTISSTMDEAVIVEVDSQVATGVANASKKDKDSESSGEGQAESVTRGQSSKEDGTKKAKVVHHPVIPKLVKLLKNYNEFQEELTFSRQLFDCGVCFSTKPGSKSIQFTGCKHVYCQACMKLYFEARISEGMMNNLTCPWDKCQTQALPTQVKKLVEDSTYQMYEDQMLQTTLESMGDVQFCPRKDCQTPTIIDRTLNMGHCPECKHSFCIYCKQAFHGKGNCSIRSKEKLDLIKEYMECSDGRKKDLERRYGKRQLKALTDTYLSEVYLKEKAKKCPHCQTPIEKSEGCNKMTCNKCDTHFCYLCEAKLPRDNPYAHFQVQTTTCYNQLFNGAHDDDDGDYLDWNLIDDDDDDDYDEFYGPYLLGDDFEAIINA